MQTSYADMELVSSNLSILHDQVRYDSVLSFTYFLDYLRSMGRHYRLYNPFFSYVIRKFEEAPGLQSPIEDLSVLQQHSKLLNLLEATLFPPADKETEYLFAFSTPWHFRPFHVSPKFEELLNHYAILSDKKALKEFRLEKTERLYAQILQRHYGLELEVTEQNVYPATDRETGLTRYFQVYYDMRFCDAIAKGSLPPIDKEFVEKNFRALCETMELARMLPPERFALEGFTVIKVWEVTETAAVTELKNTLLRMLEDDSKNRFPGAEKTLQSLVGVPGATASLLPLPRINNHLCWWDDTGKYSLAGALLKEDSTGTLLQKAEAYFTLHPDIFLASPFSFGGAPSFLEGLSARGVTSYLLAPLFRGRDLIGLLEIVTYGEALLQKKHVYRLRPAKALLIQMVSNYLQRRQDTVEQLIKDQFTSLQPSVEWKFREVAYQYLKERSTNPAAEICKLGFEQVYPAYGSIDIRSSSLRRTEAIQKDLVEHLELLAALVKELRLHHDLPILQEIGFKAGQYLDLIQQELTVENEAYVSSFITSEVTNSLHFLSLAYPDMQENIQEHLDKVDNTRGTCCQHRKRYEQSVEMINHTLSLYLQKEQEKLQSFFPHLYEKYRTDGIEYNIYIGQSIHPDEAFHPLHRRNIYLWQLNTMIDMARLTNDLLPSMPVPLQTAQLILLYGSPINISFRKDERKFDVDDAYNIRYELLKKRIDKVCIKDTGERLTQPGKIAIIYSRAKDAAVFDKYIDYLASTGRLWPTVEQLDLEDTQGVTGLKALRVQVRYD
jgi:hypothetical protein